MNETAIFLLAQVSKFFDELDTDDWPPVLDAMIGFWLRTYGAEVPGNDNPEIAKFFEMYNESIREDW